MNQEVAICLVFLMDGFNHEHGFKFGNGAAASKYGVHADAHDGYIGIVSDFAIYAEWIEEFLSDNYRTQDFPGVFHYEVTEELGKWLFNHPDATPQQFFGHAAFEIDEWFAKGLAAYLRSVSRMDDSPDMPTAPHSGLTLNASQPADVTKEGSTTMKIIDLIDTLNTIQDNHGNVDVVIRGSKETTFVDAQEVRYVKTAKRKTVYIGKAKSAQPQE